MFNLEKESKKILDAALLQYPYAFYVYGSRARGTAKPLSDIDLCIFADVPLFTLGAIREALNNLLLPMTVDVVSWNRLSDEFKAIIKDDLTLYQTDPYLGAEVIELSHPLSATTPCWPGSIFEINTEMDFPGKFRIQSYRFSAGFGTHIDTPAHMVPGGADLASLDLTKLFAPCSILVAPSEADHTFVLTAAHIKEHEARFGPLAANSWFLVMTGWGKRSSDPQAYQNQGPDGSMHFPTISVEAAEYLVSKKILGLGIDTLSPDRYEKNGEFPIHKTLLGAGILIVENLIYHPHACGYQALLQVVPLNIPGGAESPARVLLIHRQSLK